MQPIDISWDSLLSLRGSTMIVETKEGKTFFLDGVFTEVSEAYSYEDGSVVRNTDPTFTFHHKDAPSSIPEGANAKVAGKTYIIREINHLGLGRMECQLVLDRP